MFGHAYGENKEKAVSKLLLQRLGLNKSDVDLYVKEDSSSQHIRLKNMRYTDSWEQPNSYLRILKNLGIDAAFKTESYVGTRTYDPTIFIYASTDKLFDCLSSRREFPQVSQDNKINGRKKSELAKNLLLNLFGANESNLDISVSDTLNSQLVHLKKMRYSDSWAHPESYVQQLKNLGIEAEFKTESYVGNASWYPAIYIRASVNEIVSKLLKHNEACEYTSYSPKF